jgi:DNA sulfur modification protein DndC
MSNIQASLFDEDIGAAVIPVRARISELAKRGATFFVNSSAGKDSQAMLLHLRDIVPHDQIIVIHAILPGVEWDGVVEHLRDTIFDHKLLTCQSARNLLDKVRERGMFPSPAMRWCTSDHKTHQLEKLIRHTGQKLVVNCMGMRAEESPNRAKLVDFKFSERNSKNGREWYDWLPIHEWTEDEVFAKIAAAGQKPHWAYSKGMTRLSCAFCIMASKADLTTAAKLNPVLYKTYVELEREIGQVMMMPSKTKGRLTLEQITGVYVDPPVHGQLPHKEEEFALG